MDTDKKELLAEKKALRAKILAVRRELKEPYRQKASQRMIDVFCALPDFKEPKVVMCYASMGDEVQIRPLIQRWLDMGVTVTMPRVISKGQMEAVTLPDLDSLVEGEYGILTPDPVKSQVVAPEKLDMIVVPGVAFDTRGERLGMGAGFYDRFLSESEPQALRIALCFDCQLAEEIPMEVHDQRVEAIITETRFIDCRSGKVR